ncbi:hypothetical protein [Euzebya pacifica]|uniref:hypothetical protein n=1 Tax=Euzebya pacifica TaxID=1608957 RepID=UPI0030F89554
MRALLLLVVGVIVMTQSLGVLVAHKHIAAASEGVQHLHSYVVDDDGHNGHPDDAIPADVAHNSEQPTARLSGAVLLVLVLGCVVLDSGSNTRSLRTRTAWQALRPARRQPARLALLSILLI